MLHVIILHISHSPSPQQAGTKVEHFGCLLVRIGSVAMSSTQHTERAGEA